MEHARTRTHTLSISCHFFFFFFETYREIIVGSGWRKDVVNQSCLEFAADCHNCSATVTMLALFHSISRTVSGLRNKTVTVSALSHSKVALLQSTYVEA